MDSSLWPWDLTEGVVDLAGHRLREFVTHTGDSQIWIARRQRPAGSHRQQPIDYLIKRGQDAINERLYCVLARGLQVPSQLVSWTTAVTRNECAIHYLPDAVRPEQVDLIAGAATLNDHSIAFANPDDLILQQALRDVLGESDGTEWMLSGATLFRIDAAAICHPVYAHYLSWLHDMEERICPYQFAIEWSRTFWAKHLPLDSMQIYDQTLREIADWDDLIDQVVGDLADCPVRLPALLIDEFASYLCAMQDAIQACCVTKAS